MDNPANSLNTIGLSNSININSINLSIRPSKKSSDCTDLLRNKLNNDKKGMFNKVSFYNGEGGNEEENLPSRRKKNSNYRKHIDKQNVNKIFNIAKHIPEDELLRKSLNNNGRNSGKLKYNRNNSLNNEQSFKIKENIVKNEEKLSDFEMISNVFDDVLVKSIYEKTKILEAEEEESKIFFSKLENKILSNTLNNSNNNQQTNLSSSPGKEVNEISRKKNNK